MQSKMMPKRVLLFPGGFKPFHDGHWLKLKQALSSRVADTIEIVMSKKSREGVTARSTMWLLQQSEIFKQEPMLKVSVTDEVSPVRECYKRASESDGSIIYAMLDADKDDAKSLPRIIAFNNAYQEGGKYYDGIAKTWTLDLPRSSFESDGRVLSATYVRQAVRDLDFGMFIDSYLSMLDDRIITMPQLRCYWYVLGCEMQVNCAK